MLSKIRKTLFGRTKSDPLKTINQEVSHNFLEGMKTIKQTIYYSVSNGRIVMACSGLNYHKTKGAVYLLNQRNLNVTVKMPALAKSNAYLVINQTTSVHISNKDSVDTEVITNYVGVQRNSSINTPEVHV